MASEWTETTVGEAFEIGPSRTLKRGDIAPFIPMDALPVHARAFERIDSREFTGSGTRFKNGDTLIARITPCLENGKTAYVAGLPANSIGHGSTEYIVLAGRESLSDGLYGYYLARSPDFRRYAIGHMEGTSGRQRVPSTAIEKYALVLPPLTEQRAIAHILGTLDDKIELNRRRNQTLEAMARALFKDWFVDFGPVRAKMEGREPYLPADLWQLFPDRLDDEGKPEGWEQQRVKDIGQVICGKTPPTKVPEYYGDDVPFITIPEMHGKIFSTSIQKRLSLAGANSQAKKMLPPGAICVSCIATLGLVTITTESSQTNQQINSVIPAEGNETYYWYWTLKNLGEEIKAGGSGGSVLGNLSTGRFSELQVNAGTRALRVAYNSSTESMFAHILANERESTSLAQLRDTLLPKLISGEMRIKDTEDFLERVT